MQLRKLRQAALFVLVSGTGWLLDTAVFLMLTGLSDWTSVPANLLSASCGALFVFVVSSHGIFMRNDGSMLQKVLALLVFNASVILASSVVLGFIVTQLAHSASALGWELRPGVLRLAAKVLVTPITLALNFVVIRLLLERFVGLRSPTAPVRNGTG